ncbi:MAG: hypothetical protein KF691_10315 [Phycisphaeraceae bacterium]|nr:hypothetical protein [Phycisphaeraceae bacterium]
MRIRRSPSCFIAAMAFACAARATHINTARVTLSPSFSGGAGPIDLINQSAGPIDASASTTGGAGSSGDANAHTSYGFINLQSHAVGAINSAAIGWFRDSLTITAPGVAAGTQGSLTFGVRVEGFLNATQGASASSWRLSADLGGGAFDIGRSGRINSPDLFPPGASGDTFGTYSATVSFQYGVTTTLDVELSASAQASYSQNGPGLASVAPFVRLYWNGISDVQANGAPVGTFSISSESGTDWAPAAAACAGDLNNDGFVDDSDFVLLVNAYNILDCADPSMAAGCPADLNGDGFVDDSDFVLFVVAYNDLVCP